MIKNTFISFMGSIFLLLSLNLSAQSIKIETLGLLPIVSMPNKVNTFPVKVTNLTNRLIEYQMDVKLPSDWQLITNNIAEKLQSNQTQIILVSFKVSAYANKGDYNIFINANDSKKNKETLSSLEIKTSIQAKIKIQIENVNTPKYVIGGKEVMATFVVRNLSNKSQKIHLKTNDLGEVINQPEPLNMPPNSSELIQVRFITSKNIKSRTKMTLRLDAMVLNHPEANTKSNIDIDVIPNVSITPIDCKNQLPVKLKLGYLIQYFSGTELTTGFQGELFSRGFLDTAQHHQIEVHMRGPSRTSLNALGQYSRYAVAYQHFNNEKERTLEEANFYFHIGDKNFSLTPLTEYARLGRGVEMTKRWGRFEVGGFHQKPTFFNQINAESAAYVRYSLGENRENIGLHYLHKKGAKDRENETEYTSAHLYSLAGYVTPFKNTNIRFDISQSKQKDLVGKAVWLQMTTHASKKWNMASTLIYADKNYAGYYTNTKSLSTNLAYRLSNKLNASFNFRQDGRNIAQDTLWGVAPYRDRWQGGLIYHFSPKMQLGAYYRHRVSEDRMENKQFHYKEKIGKMQWIFRPSARTTTLLSAEWGKKQ